MIFLTLGSQKFPFNRLLEAAEQLGTNEVIFAQVGYSDYVPQKYAYKAFLNKDEFDAMMEKADIVITHGGTGAIMGAVKKGKKVIAVPRLAEYGEHVDDHQVQLVEEFAKMNLICACEDMDLEKAVTTVKASAYRTYRSNTKAIVTSLEEWIDG